MTSDTTCRVLENFSFGISDGLRVSIPSIPEYVDFGISEGQVLISTGSISQPRSQVVLLHKRLFPPSSRQFALADRHVGVSFNVPESVDIKGVLGTEFQTVQHSKGILSLLSIRVSQEQEAVWSAIMRRYEARLRTPCWFLPHRPMASAFGPHQSVLRPC